MQQIRQDQVTLATADAAARCIRPERLRTQQPLAALAHELDGGQGNFADADKIKADGAYDVWVCDGEFTIALIMNTESKDSVWSDVRMRQALEYAIAKDSVIADAGAGYIQPVYNIIKGLEEVTQVQGVPRKYDPAKAKELMAAAGHPRVTCKIYLEDAAMQGYGDFYLAWQEQWKKVGINVEFSVIDHGAMSQMGQSPMPGNDMRIDAIRGNPDNPAGVVIEVLSAGTVFLQGAARPPEWPDLLTKAIHSQDPNEVLSTLVQMDKLAYDDAMFIPLHTSPLIYVMSKKVHDFKYIRQGYDIANCWKE